MKISLDETKIFIKLYVAYLLQKDNETKEALKIFLQDRFEENESWENFEKNLLD